MCVYTVQFYCYSIDYRRGLVKLVYGDRCTVEACVDISGFGGLVYLLDPFHFW
jgi:hypothetical protein